MKKYIFLAILMFNIPLFANTNKKSIAKSKSTTTKKKNNNNTENQVDLSESDVLLDEEEPENYDSEYEHDEEYIKIKSEELKQEVFNDYEAIDNIILYEALMESYNKWKGTRYLWGGDSKNGIDCSALTRRVYRDVFNNYELPRVSVDQIKRGHKILSKKDLKPGDLLYFRPRNRVNHVAIYLGNSLFINASSSKGVVLSSMDNSYWDRYYRYAVRVDQAREK